MVGSLEPTVVLLQVGSNNLCQLDKSVQDIEQKLIGLVLTQTYCYHVQRVAVLQILHRQWPRRRIRFPVDIPWFNDREIDISTYIKTEKITKTTNKRMSKYHNFCCHIIQSIKCKDASKHVAQ
jgi:hypothetical protein